MDNQSASPTNEVFTPPSENSTTPPPAPPPAPENNIPNTSTKNSSGKVKKIVLIFVIFILLIGGGAGAYFFALPILNQSSEIDCQNYTIFVNQTGEVTISNNTNSPSPSQTVTVNVNDTDQSEFDVPIIQPGETATIGIISAPQQSFTWNAKSGQCQNSGTHELTITQTAQTECEVIKAYDEDWKLLTSSELGTLEPGDIIRFSVSGSSDLGTFTKAQFTINEEVRPETSELKPDSHEFYDEYEVPEGTTTFVVNAQIYSEELNQWF